MYEEEIANCDDEVRRARQLQAVSADEAANLRAKQDAVALANYFLTRCHPNPYERPYEGQPAAGKVKDVIEDQRREYNKRNPFTTI